MGEREAIRGQRYISVRESPRSGQVPRHTHRRLGDSFEAVAPADRARGLTRAVSPLVFHRVLVLR